MLPVSGKRVAGNSKKKSCTSGGLALLQPWNFNSIFHTQEGKKSARGILQFTETELSIVLKWSIHEKNIWTLSCRDAVSTK